METWYSCGYYDKEIKPVEVEKETKNQVIIKGRRCNKITSYTSYFPTWEKAYQHELEKYRKRIRKAESQLRYVLQEHREFVSKHKKVKSDTV